MGGGEARKAETAARAQGGDLHLLYWLSRRTSALNPPHVHLQVILVLIQPCLYPALRRPLNLRSPSVFSARESIQVGQASRLQANQIHVGWWCCLPKSRECSRQAAILWQQRPGNPDFLRCMNGGFVQPSPPCLRKVRAACWLCDGIECQPGTLRLSPRQVNQLQGGWTCIANKKHSRVPVSHPEAFLNRIFFFFPGCEGGGLYCPCTSDPESYTFKTFYGSNK